MVALLRSAPASATNVVRRHVRHDLAESVLVDGRGAARRRVALPAWLVLDESSLRGYVLELSAAGARLGGMGTRLRVGERVLAKMALHPHNPPVLLRAEVVRYTPVLATGAHACPELCIRFIGTGRRGGLSPEGIAEQERLEDFLSTLRG